MGSYISLVQKMNKSLEIAEKVLLSRAKNFVALVAALSQCKDGFKVKIVHTPKYFSKLTS